MKDEERLRTFVALEIAEDMRVRIGALQDELRDRAPGLRWPRPEGIHLTLRFLGPTTPSQVERLKPMLAQAAGEYPPDAVGIAGLGTFPPRGAPRVLWLGVSLPDAFSRLQAACERAAVASGFPREPRPFRAHLTLGRWRDRARRPDLPATDLGTTRVETLTHYRSQPGGGGSVYTPLARFPLGSNCVRNG